MAIATLLCTNKRTFQRDLLSRPPRPEGRGRTLSRALTFTSRAREAGCSVAARDNTHLRGDLVRGFVTHLHADAASLADVSKHLNNASKLQWKVWQFFEDPSSSKAVR